MTEGETEGKERRRKRRGKDWIGGKEKCGVRGGDGRKKGKETERRR